MFVDWLIYGLIIFGFATVLNKTAFKAQPASKGATWGLTILIFLLSVAVLSAAKVIRYQAISDSVGTPITPRNPLDMGGGFVFAWLFYSFLNRTKKENVASTKKCHKEKDPAKIAIMNKIAEEGYTAFTNGIPKTSNPYRSPNIEEENLDYIDYWDRGYVLAENRKKQQ